VTARVYGPASDGCSQPVVVNAGRLPMRGTAMARLALAGLPGATLDATLAAGLTEGDNVVVDVAAAAAEATHGASTATAAVVAQGMVNATSEMHLELPEAAAAVLGN